jgi:transposase-like protein
MNGKCPSCDSKIISFKTDNLTGERIFSCIDCGNEWNITTKVVTPKRSKWRSFLGLDSKSNN